MGEKQARIIAVANEKGGVGKTVTVLNLGAALAQAGKRVLIVDMDPQFNATQGLGERVEDGEPSVYDIISQPGAVAVEDTVRSTQWQGIDLLPSDADLAGAEIELVEEEGRENRLKTAAASIVGGYDFILLDTPPSLSLLTVNVFAFASEVLVPCQTHPYAYKALDELFDTIEAIREGINPGLQVTGVLATFFDSRTRVSHTILEKLRSDERYRELIMKTVIRANTTIAESAAEEKPVVFYRSTSYGAKDYRQLAEEILGG